jgi:hypothetical protein
MYKFKIAEIEFLNSYYIGSIIKLKYQAKGDMVKKLKIYLFITILFLLCSFMYASVNKPSPAKEILNFKPFDLVLPCQNEQSSIDYKQYFTDPEISGEIVYVIFKAKMEKEGDDVWALALLHGFKYAYTASSQAEKLAVGILFTNETGKIYYIERKVYTDFSNGKISNDEFVRRIQSEEVE